MLHTLQKRIENLVKLSEKMIMKTNVDNNYDDERIVTSDKENRYHVVKYSEKTYCLPLLVDFILTFEPIEFHLTESKFSATSTEN